MYEYNALITDVYDGDTITADIDLGFGVLLTRQKLRLLGINTPELRGADNARAREARDFLRGLVLGQKVVITTYKDHKEKFGRWLATVVIDGQNVNQLLLETGLAVPFMDG